MNPDTEGGRRAVEFPVEIEAEGSGTGRLGAEADLRTEAEARTGEERDGGLLSGVAATVRSIPGFAKLLYRLMKDRRVSAFDRALFAFTLGYLFVPVDVIPDWLPVVGGLDDLVLLGLSLDRLLYRTDTGVLLEHWDGDPEPLLLVRRKLDQVAERLPWWARALIRSGRG